MVAPDEQKSATDALDEPSDELFSPPDEVMEAKHCLALPKWETNVPEMERLSATGLLLRQFCFIRKSKTSQVPEAN